MSDINALQLIEKFRPAFGDIAEKGIELLIKRWWDRRLRENREIIMSELRSGVFDHVEEDDSISLIYKLCRSISEGIAKKNLVLLCRLMTGLSERRKLSVQSFNRFSSVLESLTYDEMIVLSALNKFHQESEQTIDSGLAADWLAGETVKGEAPTNKVMEKDETRAICAALTRTGLVTTVPTFDYAGYNLTPLFFQLIEYIGGIEAIAGMDI
ncbi:hypothetical protein HDR61_03840 [bacterium]|nr:hypothetical protein [bacterium]